MATRGKGEMFELTPWSLFQALIFSSGYIYDTRWTNYTVILQVSAEAAMLNWNLDYRIMYSVLTQNDNLFLWDE